MNNRTRTKKLHQIALVTLIAATLVAFVLGIFLARRIVSQSVTNFDECVHASGQVAEGYPEQCFWKGKSYVNKAQVIDSDPVVDTYIGLSEQEALDKAKNNQKTARVVSRDGRSLPMTKDYVRGRLNLFIKDGAVVSVEVE